MKRMDQKGVGFDPPIRAVSATLKSLGFWERRSKGRGRRGPGGRCDRRAFPVFFQRTPRKRPSIRGSSGVWNLFLRLGILEARPRPVACKGGGRRGRQEGRRERRATIRLCGSTFVYVRCCIVPCFSSTEELPGTGSRARDGPAAFGHARRWRRGRRAKTEGQTICRSDPESGGGGIGLDREKPGLQRSAR